MAFKAPRTIESFSAGEGFDEQTSQRPNKPKKGGWHKMGGINEKEESLTGLGLLQARL